MQRALQKGRQQCGLGFSTHHRNVNTETKGERKKLEFLYNCQTSPLECQDLACIGYPLSLVSKTALSKEFMNE